MSHRSSRHFFIAINEATYSIRQILWTAVHEGSNLAWNLQRSRESRNIEELPSVDMLRFTSPSLLVSAEPVHCSRRMAHELR